MPTRAVRGIATGFQLSLCAIRPNRMLIRPFHPDDEPAVVALWERCGLTRAWNDPRKDIQRKMAVEPEWFLVGVVEERIVATAMAGYDGHRGWINYLAVDPDFQRRGYGRAIIRRAEELLLAFGCPKINLQIRSDNRAAIAFYERIGFAQDDVLSFGKRLIPDDCSQKTLRKRRWKSEGLIGVSQTARKAGGSP